MGGVCGKPPTTVEDSEASDLHMGREVSSNSGLKNKSKNSYSRRGLIEKNVSRKFRNEYCVRDSEKEFTDNFPALGYAVNSAEGGQLLAGWPAWLVNVAGEAIRGWIPRKVETFEKLHKIGYGTYSNVFKARDRLKNKIVALKKVRFNSRDPESVKFMAREILILRRLDHPNIIKLEGLVTSRTSSSLFLVFEYMEHDLTGLMSLPGIKFTEPQIKCYMQQLLSGLDYCHSQGVLHRDIKGPNLLINKDGILKIADFGLASYFDIQQGARLTGRVVTLWYRPPELLLGATQYGVAVDLWSVGCIVGELYTGSPILPGRTEIEQVHMIFKLCGSPSEDYWRKVKLPYSSIFKPAHPYRQRIAERFKDLPDVAIRFMEVLLSIDPADRGTAETALMNEFFTTQPVACDPSSMPKYLPSKGIDSSSCEEKEAISQGSSVVAEQQYKNHSTRSKELLRIAPAPDPNAESSRPMQVRRRSEIEYFHPGSREESASKFPPCREMMKDGQPNPGAGWARQSASNLLTLSASRGDMSIHSQVESTDSQIGGQIFESRYDGVSTRNPDQRRHAGRIFMVGGLESWQVPFSGPLIGPSSNVERLLEIYDRRIREVGRRLREDNEERIFSSHFPNIDMIL